MTSDAPANTYQRQLLYLKLCSTFVYGIVALESGQLSEKTGSGAISVVAAFTCVLLVIGGVRQLFARRMLANQFLFFGCVVAFLWIAHGLVDWVLPKLHFIPFFFGWIVSMNLEAERDEESTHG